MGKAQIRSRRQDDGTWWWYWEIPTGTSAAGYQPTTTLLVGNGRSWAQVMSVVSRLLAGSATPPEPEGSPLPKENDQ